MSFELQEKLFWPFVMAVGSKITCVDDGIKERFWRDNALMSSLMVVPASVLEWFELGLSVWVYLSLVTAGGMFYVIFIVRWRKYLKSLNANT
jgi:hypothetical protein